MPKELRNFQKTYKNRVVKKSTMWAKDSPIFKDVTLQLKRYGYHKIGGGAYGLVFISERHPYALKVFYNDPAYINWLEYCKKNQDNPYIPKIKGKYIRVIPEKEVYAVRMEKLEPCNLDKYAEFNKVVSRKVYEYDDHTYYIVHGSLKEPTMPIDDHLQEVLNFLLNIRQKNKHTVDLHHNNIMQRLNGQLVVVDPLAY